MSLPIFTPTFVPDTFYLVVKGSFESDTPYLQYHPARNTAYGVSSGFAALLLASLATAFLARAHVFLTGTLASACLMTSFFLRASLDAIDHSHMQIYMASLILDSCGAFLLTFMSLIMASKWIRYLDGGRSAVAGLLLGVGALLLVGSVTLEATGIALAFDKAAWNRHVGHILHISAISANLGISGIGLLVTVWKAVSDTGREILVEMVSLAAPFTLLALWASFALAQAKLPLENVASTSEVMWYVLNPLPLALVLVVWTLFNAPRVFSFDEYAERKAPPAYSRGSRHGGNYEYPPRDPHIDYSYPLRVQPASEYHANKEQPRGQREREQMNRTYYQYDNGRGMTTEDKIQKAILRYA
ncbi:hypothetical protein GQ54DRAFT_298235 [Martensiomyces pterosporus]|nr:hypothetical protein GQ54DRAFT_298235 [Martensiomyces pterosporus]